MQMTLKRQVTLDGIGLHSGRPVRLVLKPAAAEQGIWFKRRDVIGRDALVPAVWDAVSDTTLNTTIRNSSGVTVSTIEHLMAALSGLGVTNAMAELDGPEVPIMDGSAEPFVAAILRAGLRELGTPRRVIAVRRTVEVSEGDALARIEPAPEFEIRFEIDFSDAAIGRQGGSLVLRPGTFRAELADCRTFCRRSDVDAMQAQGLALGGSLGNAVVVAGDKVLNPGGFRRTDECVRHKMLDVVGDLALAGAPLIGRYTGVRAGHALTNRLLRKLFLTDGAIEVLTPEAAQPARHPLLAAV